MNGKRVFALALLAAAVTLPWQGGPLAAVSVEPSYDPAATLKAAVRLRNFNSSSEPGEIFLGKGGLPPEGRVEQNFYGGIACDGSIPEGSWLGSNHVRFTYDPGSGTIRSEVQASHAYCLEYHVGDLGVLNYLKLDVFRRTTGSTVNLQNVVLNGNSLGSFEGGSTATWQVTGLDLSDGFVLEGDLVLVGFQPGGEINKAEISAGQVESPDTEGPIATSVVVSPDPAYLNGEVTLRAILDDTTTGDSHITTAEYSLNDGPWVLLVPSDSVFDAPQEEAAAAFPVTQVGMNKVCVRATDAFGNRGQQTCAAFVVGYKFKGFFWPIDSDDVNRAHAGQVVPTIWRLTDANGAPIANPGSFAGLHSYRVDCQTLAGDPASAAEEHGVGKLGLWYYGHGYWQFIWKTPKQYRGSCRAMYVEFDSTMTSPIVIFRFR